MYWLFYQMIAIFASLFFSLFTFHCSSPHFRTFCCSLVKKVRFEVIIESCHTSQHNREDLRSVPESLVDLLEWIEQNVKWFRTFDFLLLFVFFFFRWNVHLIRLRHFNIEHTACCNYSALVYFLDLYGLHLNDENRSSTLFGLLMIST